MTPAEYIRLSHELALYPVKQEVPYLTLGMAGEAGEVANLVKKQLRGDFGEWFAGVPTYHNDEFVGYRSGVAPTTEEQDAAYNQHLMKVKDELGDVLWYYGQLLRVFGLTFEEVMLHNINKLRTRQGKEPYVETTTDGTGTL